MCRLIGYRGKTSISLSELIEKPENSLIKQSLETKLGKKGINADGFGISWYNQDIDNTPGIFKSTQPAWNDNNLKHLCNKLLSNCFLGHVRASTVGDVTINNCHPFSYKNILLYTMEPFVILKKLDVRYLMYLVRNYFIKSKPKQILSICSS